MGILLSTILGFIPMLFYATILYWVDRFEKEPLKLLAGMFLWGAFIASIGAFFINTLWGIEIYLLTGSASIYEVTTSLLISPIVEETLKGIAILLIFMLFRDEFDTLLDGIVYAGIVALGFAATENTYYIYNYGYAQGGLSGLISLSFIRIILVGWQHPFYTAFIGLGLGYSRIKKSSTTTIVAPILGWILAVTAHALHNTLALFAQQINGLIFATLIDWSGWFCMVGVIIWAIYRERKWIEIYLKEEVELGTITKHQYYTAKSAYAQTIARLLSITKNRFTATRHFYQLCAELAYKKHQVSYLKENDYHKFILHYRKKLEELQTQAITYPLPATNKQLMVE